MAFEFLVLTAARSAEVRGAAWSEIDLEAATWVIPAGRMKAARTRRLAGDRQQLHVVGASGVPVPVDCRPSGTQWTTVGFPLHPDTVPADGTVRIAVLFMDFPDAEAAHTTQAEAGLGLPWAEAYLETVSYNQLDIGVAPLCRTLRDLLSTG